MTEGGLRVWAQELRESEAHVAWGVRDVVWAGLFMVALFLGAAMLMAVGGLWLRLRTGVRDPSGLLRLFLALAELLFLVPTWVFSVHKYGARWRDLGLRRFHAGRGCLAVAGLFCMSLWVNLLWGLVLVWLKWPGQREILPLFGEGAAGLALAGLGLGVVAPFAEEVFFRGFVFAALSKRLGLWRAVAIDALLFAVLHFTPSVILPLFILGVALCLLYRFTGSIWPGILLHASINSLALAATWVLGQVQIHP